MMLYHGSAVWDVLPVYLQAHFNDGNNNGDDYMEVQVALLNYLQAVDICSLVHHLLSHIIRSKMCL